MGEKIVKKIRGMSWTTKISLVLIFTFILCISIYIAHVQALNKVTNYDFASGAANWIQDNNGTGTDGCGLTTSTTQTAFETAAWDGTVGNPLGSYKATTNTTANNAHRKMKLSQTIVAPGSGTVKVKGRFDYYTNGVSWNGGLDTSWIRLDLYDSTNATFVGNLACVSFNTNQAWTTAPFGADVSVTGGTTYTIRVTIKHQNGATDGITALWVDNIIVNFAPTGLTSPSQTTNSVSLSWTDSTTPAGPNLYGYNVYYGTTAGGPYPTKANASIIPAGTTTYTVTSLNPGTTYYFVVEDVDVGKDTVGGTADDNVSPYSAQLTQATLGPGSLQFSSATYSVAESGPTATITVTRTGGSSGVVGVSYATSNGTATQPADYTTASGTLSWGDGDAANKTFTVSINNDTLDEANETVDLTLSSPTGGATLGAQSTAVLTITDDDATPTVQFSAASSSGSEATTPANMAVSLSAASGLTVTVNYSVTGGTATSGGVDYTLAAGTLTFAPGETTKNISATIVDDAVVEANETIIVTLAGPTNATLGAQTTHTYTINDNDAAAGSLQFSSATYSVAESGPTATITVTRTGGSSGVVGVSYATSNGTATQPADYTTASGTLSWGDGDAANKTFTVSINNDTLDEADETVDLTLSSPTGGATLGAQSTAVLTITDDDATPTVAFAAASSSGAESVTPALMAVNLSAASGLTVTVNYSVTGGTATGGGTDYTLAAGTLTFNPGVTTQNVSATIVNDTLDENNETITVTLAGPTNATLGAQTTHTYTINDDDAQPTVAFAAASSSGAESVTPALMAVNLSAASGLTVTVNYSTGGTATGGGVDYTLAAGTLTFTPGVTTQNISATIVDDAVVEANETIIVTLAGPTNATLGAQTTHTYTINDNDAPAVTQTLDSFTDNSANTLLPVTNLPMATIASTATGGGVALTPTRVSVGGTVAAADVASIRVLWGAAQVGIVNNPAGLINIDIALAGAGSGTNNLVYQISLNASATGKTFNLTVTSVTGATTDNIPLPKTTATRIAGINPLMHNSATLSSTKWAPNGWGIAGGKYGEFTCGTCHIPRATNIKGVRSTVTAPSSPAVDFPGGANSPVNFQSFTTSATDMGNDSGNTPRVSSTRICEVCHTYDGTLPYDSGVNAHPYSVGSPLSNHYSADNTDCTSCHKHNVGFKGMGCDSCHGNPPTVNTLGGPNGLANNPGATGSQTAGSHNMHKNTLSYDCPTCHNSYTMPDPSQDIDIGFSMFGKDGTGTTYNGQSVVPSYTGKNNTIVTKTGSAGGSNLTCSGLYCHGSTLTAGTLTSPWWDGTGTVTCGTCHGKDAATPPTKINHPRHAGSGAGGISVLCTDCHGATAGAQGHVNGDVSWSLNTGSSKFGLGAIYRTGASGSTGATAPSASYGTCSTIYCHSDVQNGTASGGPTSYGTPTWGATSVSCSQGVTGCHGNAPATPTANNAHGTHTTGNYSFACSACHNNGGDESANHANGTLNMTISATYGGTYSQGDHAPAPVSLGYGTCSNTYCHGNYTGGLNASPAWTDVSAACGTCHKYLNTDPPIKINHPRHAGQAAGQLNLACAKCHEPARVLGDGHVNLSVQWNLDRTDPKIGSGATYSGAESGATGSKAPSASYGNCNNVYCHSTVQAGDGTSAPAYVNQQWGVAAPLACSTASCHGNPPATPTASGAHATHTGAPYSYACSACHKNAGDETAKHADRNIDMDMTNYGASALYSQSPNPPQGGFGYCTNTNCHGSGISTRGWGVDLTNDDNCTICHGNKTAGADQSALAYKRAPGADGAGVDTSGTVGTITRSVSNDTEVGAHDGHLRGVALISSAKLCTECHTVPASVTTAGHIDSALPAEMTFGTLAKTGSAPAAFDAGTHTCSNVYCHNEAYFSTSQHTNGGTDTTPTWNDTTYFGVNVPPLTATECGRCHFYDVSDCASCHNHVAAGNLSFVDKTKHIDGLVQGAGDCIACHTNAQTDGIAPARRAMAGEFNNTWSHKRTAGGVVTKYDCGVCHMEGDPVTGAWTALHKDNKLDFRDPDTGVTIKGVTFAGTPGSYTSTAVDATASVFARNTGSNTLEAFAQAVQVNLCLKCHDSTGAASASARVSGGTATKPFGASAGTVLDISAHFATANASYHPVSGRQNNSYADANTMNAPWNTAGTPGGTKATKDSNTQWGWLMSCWDCHDSSAAGRVIGGATASVTAHGNAVTLRASYRPLTSEATTFAAGTPLCNVCHKASTYADTGGNGAGSAFASTTVGAGEATHSSGGRHTGDFNAGCERCHSSRVLGEDVPRPYRAEDVHGYNKRRDATDWPAVTTAWITVPSAQPPRAFLRNTDVFQSWRYRTVGQANVGGASDWGCVHQTSMYAGCSNTAMQTIEQIEYTPGGAY